MNLLGDRVERRTQRYAVDKAYPNVYYLPENADFHVREGVVRWEMPEGGKIGRAHV